MALLHAIAHVAGDVDEMRDRMKTIESTFDQPLDASTTGLPTLLELLAPPNAKAFGDRIDAWVIDSADSKPEGDDGEDDEFILPPPAPLRQEAYFGLGGDLTRFICGEDGSKSEASASAMLLQFLVTFGCAVGERTYVQVAADRHYSNEFALIIGATARARKGLTAGPVIRLFAEADPNAGTERAFERRTYTSIGSGQGLIHAVRDKREELKFEKDSKTEKTTMRMVVVDHGVADKRLLIRAGEFQGVIAAASRPDSTISSVLRDAWDHRKLGALIKNEGKGGDLCERPHISVIGHMTRMEFLAKLKSTEETNGFLNRFLIFYQPLPAALHALGGTRCEGPEWEALRERLACAWHYWQNRSEPSEAKLAPQAEREWVERIYPKLSNPLVGERVAPVIARADAHCMRLAQIFATVAEGEASRGPSFDEYCERVYNGVSDDIDSKPEKAAGTTIELVHLLAAEAIVDYANASAAYVFTDPFLQQLQKLRSVIAEHGGESAPWKETRLALRMRVEQFDTLIEHLQQLGLVRVDSVATTRRPRREIVLCDRQ